MTLEEYVLTYTGTTDSGEEGIVCNIPDYYNRYIKPLEKRFEEYNFYGSRTVICCFHEDHDPSLGLINHRFLSDVKIYHCFGCGAVGTVIRMHQYIQDKYYNRKLTDIESAKEVAELFEVPLDDFEEFEDDDFNGKYISTMKRIDKLKTSYSSNNFSQDLLNLRKREDLNTIDKLNALNTECIKMIATTKKLYQN